MNGKGKNTTRGVSAAEWDLNEADDPADWNSTYSFLRGIDSSLRCDLCYNILTAPVAVKECNHVFCSVCIRNAINQPDPNGKHCPKCMRKNVYDSSLVPQPVIEVAAEAWKVARPELARKQKEEQDRLLANTVDAPSSPQVSLSPETSRPLKRARPVLESSPEFSSSAPARVTRSGSARVMRGLVEDSIIIDSDTDEDASFQPSSSGTVAPVTSQNKQQTGNDKDYRSLQPSDLAPCPLCSRKVTLSVMNQHLDKGCEASDPDPSPKGGVKSLPWFQKPSKFTTKRSTTSASRSKIARPNYNVMKEADIRKMLSESQLPKVGSRERIIERHRQWVTLYNANLDASEKAQKTDVQLRRELAEWDRGHDESLRSKSTNKSMTEDAAKLYQETNRDHFQDLIKIARESHAKNKAAHQQKKNGSEGEEPLEQ